MCAVNSSLINWNQLEFPQMIVIWTSFFNFLVGLMTNISSLIEFKTLPLISIFVSQKKGQRMKTNEKKGRKGENGRSFWVDEMFTWYGWKLHERYFGLEQAHRHVFFCVAIIGDSLYF